MTDAADDRMPPPSRVLVTGAAGRLGSAVVAELDRRGISVAALDRREVDGVPHATVGAVDDPDAVAAAIDGADAVIHTAALASPTLGTPPEVFRTNTLSTFTVLDAAAQRGIRRAVISSSFSITGLPRGGPDIRPPALPIDEDTSLQVRDVYALTKQVDEATGRMIAASSGMTVTALRFPLLGSPERELRAHAKAYRDDPGAGAADVWSYLDTRDAARAAVDALLADAPREPGPGMDRGGFAAWFVAAPNTLSAIPTEELLDRYLPGVPRRRRFPGTTVAIDVARAEAAFGFRAEHVHPIEELLA